MRKRQMHGWSRKRLYNIWENAKQRCYNPKKPKHRIYGKRGITVCKEWRDDFKAFKDWALANGYRDDLTLDRIDNEKGYFPENCRWATYLEQNNNMRKNVLISVYGETLTIAQWARKNGLPYMTIYNRHRKGRTPEECVFKGKLKRRRKP